MILRSGRSSDFPRLYEIDQSCFPPGVSYSENDLKRFIRHRNSKTWVAEEGDEIVGFLIAFSEPQAVGHIITIDVRERWRRRGVGGELMDVAEQWARRKKLKVIYLETAEDNRVAQNFYLARGYAKVEQIPNYYSNGTTAWVMVKWL